MLIKYFLFALTKFDFWHKAQVSMTSNVYREAKNSQEHLLSEKKARKTFKTLRGLRRKHSKTVFLGHLNVNS